MNRHLQKILRDLKDLLLQLKQWYFELSRTQQIVVTVVGVLIVVTIGRAIFHTSSDEEIKKLPRAVTLSSVGDLSNKTSLIPLLGTVTSRNEATVRAESGGQLRVVYKHLGDYVVAGQIIAELGITVEEWGGKIPMAKVSAKKGLGIDELLDTVLLVAELERDRITANPKRLAAGTVIEAHVDKGEGPVATVLVQAGTLRRNDWLAIGNTAYGRVRLMRDWMGKALEVALPGTPVKVLGFKVTPSVGDILEVPEDPKLLEQKKSWASQQMAESFTATKAKPVEGEEQTKKMLNVILKTDVLGSLEAILGMFEKVQHELVGVTVIQKGLGNITDADIDRAATSQPSVVYGFNVLLPTQMEILARDKNVEVKLAKVIYDLFDDVVAKLNALLPQEVIVTEQGSMEVAAIFRSESGKMIVGARVKEGKIFPSAKVRVWRGEQLVGDGVLEALQIGKSPVKEVAGGQECGVSYRGKVKLQVGDRLDAYSEESKARKLETFR
jgi:translation initiation factor IF-2